MSAIHRLVAAVVASTATASFAQAQLRAEPEQLGGVHFETSCARAVAPTFDRAVALLHSFEFGAAIRAFNDVSAQDSTCAMAKWGLAMSRWTNPMVASLRSAAILKPGREAADAATRLGARASERERVYIGAVAQLYQDYETKDQRSRQLAYERAMRDLVQKQPADTEAKVFHAIALAAVALPTDKTFAPQLEAGRTLEALWPRLPNHPGIAHYIIHAYDYPALADKAREAARRYASIAPSAAHAQHMPSHTFTRVGMWQQSVTANRASRAIAERDGAFGEALHASDYMMYAFLQLGMEDSAKAVRAAVPALAARFDPSVITGAAPGSAGVFAIAAINARWALERGAWAEAAALVPTSSQWPYAEAMTYFARALGASRTGDLAKAKASADSLTAIHRRLVAGGEAYWGEQVAIQALGARAWIALAEKRDTDALALMREAATREDATDKNAVTPGPLAPARELLGDLLVALKRTEEAKAEYRATLQREPGRRHALRALGEI